MQKVGAFGVGGKRVVVGYLFLTLFILFTPVSIYLLIKQRNHRLIVWGALACFIAGMSGLQVGLEKIIIPFMGESGVSEIWLSSAQMISGILNIAINTFPYYLTLVFFMVYAGYPKMILNVLLLVPVLLSFGLSEIYPISRVNYQYILAWGIPYALGAAVLLGRVLLKEKFMPNNRKHAAMAFIFFVPEMFVVLYQIEGTYIDFRIDFLIYIPFLCVLGIVIGFVLYMNNAFHSSQDKTVLSKMQIATSLMQHAFKNAIGKNKLNALNIGRSLKKGNYDEVDRHLQNLLSSNDHLLKLVSKLSYMAQNDLSAELESCDIGLILDKVIDAYHDQPQISFEKRYSSFVLSIDPTLMTECLTNVVGNAIEAMEEVGRGKIIVSVERRKRKAVITITDTGKGMSKEQLNQMYDPFFSTKLITGNNFGLGMFHVKEIMKAHRGKVEAVSEPGKGTTIALVLPWINKNLV